MHPCLDRGRHRTNYRHEQYAHKQRVAPENQAGQISDPSNVWFTRAGSFCSGDGDISANFFRTLIVCFTTSINLEASNQVLRCAKKSVAKRKGRKWHWFAKLHCANRKHTQQGVLRTNGVENWSLESKIDLGCCAGVTLRLEYRFYLRRESQERW